MITTIQFTYEHDAGDLIHAFEVTAEVIYSVDDRFGEDADGNRGERRVSVEDVLLARVFDCDGVRVEAEDLSEEIKRGMIECAETRFYER